MNLPRILHLISRLDGYGGARVLRALAARQAGAGQCVTVAAFAADVTIVDELRAAGVDVQVLRSRWAVDPTLLWKLAKLQRSRSVDVTHAWDALAHVYARMTT